MRRFDRDSAGAMLRVANRDSEFNYIQLRSQEIAISKETNCSGRYPSRIGGSRWGNIEEASGATRAQVIPQLGQEIQVDMDTSTELDDTAKTNPDDRVAILELVRARKRRVKMQKRLLAIGIKWTRRPMANNDGGGVL